MNNKQKQKKTIRINTSYPPKPIQTNTFWSPERIWIWNHYTYNVSYRGSPKKQSIDGILLNNSSIEKVYY